MGKHEATVQKDTMLDAAGRGQCWRNNVGACVDEKGNHVRYGLANTSRQMNRVIKSSDLIGYETVEITPDMIGKKVAIFTAFEIKEEDWIPAKSGSRYDRENAQDKFMGIVREGGGIAGFVRSLADVAEIRRNYFSHDT